MVGRPGGSPPPGWQGRVTVGPGRWPVPPQWRDQPERWSCASVSFYVAGGGWYDGGYWRNDGRSYDGGYWHNDGHRYDDDRYDDDRYDDGHRRRDGDRVILHDSFRMKDCSDGYSRGFNMGPTDATIEIDCVESSKKDPTEIVGRLSMKNDWGDDVLFRIDIEGDHGDVPSRGRVYVRQWGSVRVEVEVVGYSMAPTKHWQVPRMKWIEFDVRVRRSEP